jgi:hypothetical protein
MCAMAFDLVAADEAGGITLPNLKGSISLPTGK